MKSRFGLHVRLKDSLFNAIDKAERLEQKLLQIMFMVGSRKPLQITDEQIAQFVSTRRRQFDYFIVHAAYWSNLTSITGKGFYCLLQEITLAEKLQCTHIVIHPGSFATSMTRKHRINYIAKAVHELLQATSNIIILLENSPHKDLSFSANIDEFADLFVKLEQNDRVKMCIDTAHAYVSGYDISTPEKVDSFIVDVCKKVGQKNIGLIHCNDTKKKCGAFLDEHAVPGHGNIGMEALYRFVHHPLLAHIPVIFEMPAIDESLELDIIEQFNNMEIL